jgi:hypothetical protein
MKQNTKQDINASSCYVSVTIRVHLSITHPEFKIQTQTENFNFSYQPSFLAIVGVSYPNPRLLSLSDALSKLSQCLEQTITCHREKATSSLHLVNQDNSILVNINFPLCAPTIPALC